MNYAIRSSLYLLLLILDNIVSSDRVSVSSEVSQYGISVIRKVENTQEIAFKNNEFI